jgi:hypothetical protein
MGHLKKVLSSKTMQEAWRRVFLTTDPFSNPFTRAIDNVLVFYPTVGYHLSEEQYEALLKSRQSENKFYLSEVEWQDDFFSRGAHWLCDSPSYDDYLSIPLMLENAIYSSTSVWGALMSHENHALVGGSKEFIERLRQNYPQWKTDKEKLRMSFLGQDPFVSIITALE